MTKIIAECGINHGGDYKIAKEMAEAALDAGADFVKFQFFDPQRLSVQRNNPDLAKVKNLREPCYCVALGNIPRAKRMLTVFSLPDAVKASDITDNMKLSHIESSHINLVKAVQLCATYVWITTAYQGKFDLLNNQCETLAWFGIPLEKQMACSVAYPSDLKTCKTVIECCMKLHVGYSDHSGPSTDAAYYAIDEELPVVEVHVKLNNQKNVVDESVSKTMRQLEKICRRAHT